MSCRLLKERIKMQPQDDSSEKHTRLAGKKHFQLAHGFSLCGKRAAGWHLYARHDQLREAGRIIEHGAIGGNAVGWGVLTGWFG